MSNKEKTEKLAQLVKNAETALKEAEAYADEHGLTFYFAPAYGMGGSYRGAGSKNHDWSESSCYGEEEFQQEGQWYSSSHDC